MAGRRPVVGLALGSGGARGWAHIGVLKALNKLNIYPDVVAGTSAGALVGAAYACKRLDALERYALSLTKGDVAWHLLTNYSFLTEGGFLQGQRLMEQVMGEILGTWNIEDMPLKFATVATNIHTGREVWIREGPLFTAVRASMAVPVLISPIKADGKWLMDGALVNPVPVSVCRALGADVVIAVNLNFGMTAGRHRTSAPRKATAAPPQPPVRSRASTNVGTRFTSAVDKGLGYLTDHIPFKKGPEDAAARDSALQMSVIDVALLSIDIMQEGITRARMAGEPPEVQVSPRLHRLGLLEFYRAADSIAEGYNATLRVQGLLEAELPELFTAAEPVPPSFA